MSESEYESRKQIWDEAGPAVDEALDQITRHVEWVKVTYGKGPDSRDEFLAQLKEFGWRIDAVRDVVPLESSIQATKGGSSTSIDRE